MSKETILSNIGFLLGIVGIIIALLPFISDIESHIFSVFLPIFLGILGFTLAFKIKNKLNDDIVKAGLVLNPISIIFGIVQILL